MTASLKLPRSLDRNWTSLNDSRSFPMTFQQIEVERVFIRFLELSMRMGFVTKPMKLTSEEEYKNRFLEALNQDDRITGLDPVTRKTVLDGWLKAAVLKFEGVGMGKNEGSRLAHPRPIYLGVIRSGLPSKTPLKMQHASVGSFNLVTGLVQRKYPH